MLGVTFATKVTKWEVTNNAVLNNQPDLEHLEPDRQELMVVHARVIALGDQQMALEARLQEIMRELKEDLRLGEAVVSRLRSGVRAKYGFTSEKLLEFQLRPMPSRRRRSTAPEPPAPETTAAEA